MSAELNIYTVRPDGTAIWLPDSVAHGLGVKWGDHLTPAQYEGDDIQGLISRRLAAEKGRRA